MDKRQEARLALIIGGIFLMFGAMGLAFNHSFGAIGGILLFMVIPGTIIAIHGVKLSRKNEDAVPGPNPNPSLYVRILIAVGLTLSMLVVFAICLTIVWT
jgi:hypothetical protein